jgi:type I restriction enzyme S subunit
MENNYQENQNWLYSPFFHSEWEKNNLYSLAIWLNGMAFRDFQFSDIGMPIIKIAEIKNGISDQTRFTNTNYENKYFIKSGDMLFAWSGQPETSIDVSWWNGPEGWLNQHIFKVTPSEKCNPVYFYYLLKYLRPNFVAIAKNKQTIGLGHVTIKDLQKLLVRIPKLKDQIDIAKILGELDDKIELNRQMNATLEAMAQAVFRQWFVENEEVHNWEVGSFSDIANFVKGVSYRSDDLVENSDMALVTLKSMARGGGYREEGLKPFIGEYKPEQKLSPGEVVIAHTDLTQAADVIGKAARIEASEMYPSLVASLDMVIVRPKKAPYTKEYLYGLLSQVEFSDHAYGYTNGTTVLHLSVKALPEYQFRIPPWSRVERYTELISPIFVQIDNNKKQSQILANLRNTLLPKLMRGEIRIGR